MASVHSSWHYPTHEAPRVSLRILVERNADLITNCQLCEVNDSLLNSNAQKEVRKVGMNSSQSKLASIKDMLLAKYKNKI